MAESQTVHCYMHAVDETVTPNTYLVCFECSHAYQTEADLEREWHEFIIRVPSDKLRNPQAVFRKADDITYCPLCLHDF